VVQCIEALAHRELPPHLLERHGYGRQPGELSVVLRPRMERDVDLDLAEVDVAVGHLEPVVEFGRHGCRVVILEPGVEEARR